MYKKQKKFFISIFFLIFLSSLGVSTNASSENMTFSMNVIQPDNQYDKNVTYFDLLVKPDETQKLKINVSNTGKEKSKIKVTPTNAVTNDSGIVDYSIRNEDYPYDPTLKNPFTTLVSQEQVVELEPGQSKEIEFDFKSPSEKFDGIILGGFAANLVESEKEENKKSNVSFNNKFQLVKAVVIRNSDNKVKENIILNDVKPALRNYRTAITVNLQNTMPVLLGDVTVKADITKKNSTKSIQSEVRKNIEFAPNSNFDFPIMWGNKPLEPGEYTLKLSLKTKSESFDFNEDFNISRKESYNINQKAINLKTENNFDKIIIIVLVVIIIILITIFFLLNFKKKKYKIKKRKNRKRKNNK